MPFYRPTVFHFDCISSFDKPVYILIVTINSFDSHLWVRHIGLHRRWSSLRPITSWSYLPFDFSVFYGHHVRFKTNWCLKIERKPLTTMRDGQTVRNTSPEITHKLRVNLRRHALVPIFKENWYWLVAKDADFIRFGRGYYYIISMGMKFKSLVHNHPYVLLQGLCGQNLLHFVAFRTVNARTSHEMLARRSARRRLRRIKNISNDSTSSTIFSLINCWMQQFIF